MLQIFKRALNLRQMVIDSPAAEESELDLANVSL